RPPGVSSAWDGRSGESSDASSAHQRDLPVADRPANGMIVSAASGRPVAAADANGGFAPLGPCADDGDAIAAAGGRAFVAGQTCPVAAFATATGRPLWAWRRRGNAIADAVLVTANRVY